MPGQPKADVSARRRGRCRLLGRRTGCGKTVWLRSPHKNAENTGGKAASRVFAMLQGAVFTPNAYRVKNRRLFFRLPPFKRACRALSSKRLIDGAFEPCATESLCPIVGAPA